MTLKGAPHITNKSHVKVVLTQPLSSPFRDALTPCGNPGAAQTVVRFSLSLT